MPAWRRGTAQTLVWAAGFAIFTVVFAVLLMAFNGWDMEFNAVTTWLPVTLAVAFGALFTATYFWYNRKRHFLHIPSGGGSATEKIKKALLRKRGRVEDEGVVFKRVPWHLEQARMLRTDGGSIMAVEKLAGVDIVVEGESAEELKALVDEALRLKR